MNQEESPQKEGGDPLTQAQLDVNLILQNIAKKVDDMLKEAAGPGIGFSVMIYTPGRFQYVSNAARPAAYMALKSLLTQWEAEEKARLAREGPRIIVPGR